MLEEVRCVIGTTASLVLLTACQSANVDPTRNGVQTREPPAVSVSFSRPKASDGKGPPSETWIFASNGEAGNVDVYSAKTLEMISQCSCTGVGLAVDPRSGDLAVGTKSATVTVWHVKNKQITLFATLKLSQGPYSIGLAFDKKGDLYAANAGDGVIDFFNSSEIEAGGGGPARTLFTSNLNEVEYLTADAHNLLADGYNSSGQPLLVSVDTRTGADTILQGSEHGVNDAVARSGDPMPADPGAVRSASDEAISTNDDYLTSGVCQAYGPRLGYAGLRETHRAYSALPNGAPSCRAGGHARRDARAV